MTSPNTPSTPGPDVAASSAARQDRVATLTQVRRTKRRHPAQGSRIATVGLAATTTLGLVAVMGYSASPTSDPAPAPAPAPAHAPVTRPSIIVMVRGTGPPDTIATTVTPSAGATTTLTARPTVRAATSQAQAPAASTSGSN